jgi:ubiquinone/menaquinone biosynthesis C-methylase UbiE
MSDGSKDHWDNVYQTKAPDSVSWYLPHLERSVDLIQRVAPNPACSVIDVGSGESTLVNDLLARGYRDITVLDISMTAIHHAWERTGALAQHVTWMVADITKVALPSQRFDVWHDRAVFHFLTDPDARVAYVERVAQSMKVGGHVIVATFGPEGPTKCSGLDVVRYDADSLHGQFGRRFELLDSTIETHRTPFGTTQQFLYCLCRVE